MELRALRLRQLCIPAFIASLFFFRETRAGPGRLSVMDPSSVTDVVNLYIRFHLPQLHLARDPIPVMPMALVCSLSDKALELELTECAVCTQELWCLFHCRLDTGTKN